MAVVRFCVEPTVVLKVEGPEGTSAWPREKFDVIRDMEAHRDET
jgi:hypothetical protein